MGFRSGGMGQKVDETANSGFGDDSSLEHSGFRPGITNLEMNIKSVTLDDSLR